MNSARVFALFVVGALLFLASCSGAKKVVCTTNCGGNGNATLTVTLTDAAPSGVTFLNFNLPIASMSLTPSGGGADVALLSTPINFETTRLQADTASVGAFQVAPGTYTALNVFVTASPNGVWFNASGSTILGCATGTVCNPLSGPAPGKITIDLTKAIGGSGLVLTANEKIGVGVDFNLNNAITTTGGIAIDLTQANVFTATTLPRTGQASGTLDTIDGITGIVTAVSSSSITVKSDLHGTVIASVASSTALEDPLSQCIGGAAIAAACIAVNSIVGLDAVVNTDGTLTASVIDLLSRTSGDDLEGVIVPTSDPATFELVVSDKSITSTNSTLLGVTSGSMVFLAPGSASFAIDAKNLPLSNPAGFSGAGDLLAGQQIRARISSASTTSGKINATATSMLLRYSRITATVDHTASPVLYLNTLPAYLGLTSAQQVQTYSPETTLDGISALTDLQAGQTATVRALYLHNATPPFLADKIRKH